MGRHIKETSEQIEKQKAFIEYVNKVKQEKTLEQMLLLEKLV